ncbi:metal-sensitive transcriptional regulator [Botrimarina mediterranea]|uniref:Copper-sensing transcriptional repressor CsoR n=1 Tax=Botrimarina mediterranea TaxID=2528022 RepID=A0A518K7N1_9BACT|nr:metal-sensitive transcriptional regulator [Botrimarina mediterranea]MCA9138838.1 metal-sensitive transcriptional regulator [Planctomycetales bacterium]QDV73792.1 Copper-sensing transcriptional repressor CsoR [Botrimarina mediterranea]QDV78438.1 Copper-sensing transcriptional repressor CsoR [Planctomycetes bacterium K2D]
MLSDEEKTKLGNRLRRIAGQVAAVQRMMDEDAYCVEILTQIAAASGALGKVGQKILESHIKSCVAGALESGNAKQRDEKLEELIKIFRKYSRVSE